MFMTWLDLNVPRTKMVWHFSCGVLAKILRDILRGMEGKGEVR